MRSLEEEQSVLSVGVSALKGESEGVKVQLKVHGARLVEVEDKIERLERERRRNVLVIDGLPEEEREQLDVTVDKIFSDLQTGITSRACTAIFRRGKQQKVGDNGRGQNETVRVRPVIVIFPSAAEKSAIFRNLRKLKDKEDWKKVFFNDNLTEKQANEQRDLRALAAYAKSKDYNASVKGGVLWIDGRHYRYEEIHRLPGDISLINAKNLHILEGKALVFQSPHSRLSNLYPCNITYRREAFLHAEGAYQYTSWATVCGYTREAQVIKFERCAFKAKSLTRDFKTTREWEKMTENVMREILTEKFKRNRPCLNFLLSTGERTLFEGTGDKKWGCGIPISKADQISFKNPGKNLLGSLLEEVRRSLSS